MRISQTQDSQGCLELLAYPPKAHSEWGKQVFPRAQGVGREGKHTALPTAEVTKRTAFLLFIFTDKSLGSSIHPSFFLHHRGAWTLLGAGIEGKQVIICRWGVLSVFLLRKREDAWDTSSIFVPCIVFQAWQNCSKSRSPFLNSARLVPLTEY